MQVTFVNESFITMFTSSSLGVLAVTQRVRDQWVELTGARKTTALVWYLLGLSNSSWDDDTNILCCSEGKWGRLTRVGKGLVYFNVRHKQAVDSHTHKLRRLPISSLCVVMNLLTYNSFVCWNIIGRV